MCTFNRFFLFLFSFGLFCTANLFSSNQTGQNDAIDPANKEYNEVQKITGRLYVNPAASGDNSGSDWTNGINSLSTALSVAGPGTEIWVTLGIYLPTGTDRSATFTIPESVKLYGGFLGTETNLEERNWKVNQSVLSGDIGVAGDSTDNCLHVLMGATGARLDGFTVSGGNADGDVMGGGLYNYHIGDMYIANCLFTRNFASQGGGIENDFCTGKIYINNCRFQDNNANHGAGVSSHDTPTKIDHCLFVGNTVSGYGAAVYNWGAKSSAHIAQCTFYGNVSTTSAGAIHSRASGISTYIVNSIMWNNSEDIVLTNGALTYVYYSCIAQSGYGDNNNISSDPLFTNPQLYDFTLTDSSLCIDSGINFFVADGDTMVNLNAGDYFGDAPDMGAYEKSDHDFQPEIISVYDVPDDQGGWVYIKINSSSAEYDAGIQQYNVLSLNPDSLWVIVGSFAAMNPVSNQYIFLAPTFADSTKSHGLYLSSFKVVARAMDGDFFYTSDVKSGYSLDNIAPHVPKNLDFTNTESEIALWWSDPIDNDFQYFEIWRNDSLIAYSVTPEFNDSNVPEENIYIIYAVDYAGNRSEPLISPLITNGISENLNPVSYALQQNYPNPFNPSTTIKYQLPEITHVSLVVINILGQKVRTLFSGVQDAGYKSVLWDGKDGAGNMLPSGLYFYQLRTKNYNKIMRMLLLK